MEFADEEESDKGGIVGLGPCLGSCPVGFNVSITVIGVYIVCLFIFWNIKIKPQLKPIMQMLNQ